MANNNKVLTIGLRLFYILQKLLLIIKIKGINSGGINSNKPIYNIYKFYLLIPIRILIIRI